MMADRHSRYRTGPANSRRRQGGVGMIEVMIALLVFAVGMMGMIAMQLGAKRASYEATQRSLATSLSRDILERMRSNPAALDNYVVNEISSQSTPATNCSNVDCTPQQLAAYDLWDWTEVLRGTNEKVTIGSDTVETGGLLNPMACITNTNGNVKVAIVWQGVNELLDPNEPCGDGDYETGVTVAGNSFRRVQTMTTYVPDA